MRFFKFVIFAAAYQIDVVKLLRIKNMAFAIICASFVGTSFGNNMFSDFYPLTKGDHSRTFEGGSVTEKNGVKVLDLHGTWKEMGRQYGYLAASCLQDIYQNFLLPKIESGSDTIVNVHGISEMLYSKYPARLKQLIEGMAETSGLTLQQLKLVNAVEYSAAVFNCSAMAAWGPYASGNLVYGRNYDAPGFQELFKDIVIVVYHPSDGALATATIGYAGEIYAVNAMNEKGLFLELNNGMPSAGTEILFDRLASTTELLTMLMDAESLEYADAFFHTVRGFASYIIGIADAQEARSYEWCAQGVARADNAAPDGLMVMTNHYVSDSWNFPAITDEESWASFTRRKDMMAMAEKYKGHIDVARMQQIMQTSMSEHGPKHTATVYQLVYEPKTMHLWMHIEGANDWQEVDMHSFMKQ